ncbi:hypothetical protein LXL04_020821 [Taraxacum kok-saghyz]
MPKTGTTKRSAKGREAMDSRHESMKPTMILETTDESHDILNQLSITRNGCDDFKIGGRPNLCVKETDFLPQYRFQYWNIRTLSTTSREILTPPVPYSSMIPLRITIVRGDINPSPMEPITLIRVCLISLGLGLGLRPRTTDRVRHQRNLSNASDHGPSPTSQANSRSAIFKYGPSPRQNVGPSPWSDITTSLSNARTTDRVRGLQSESESEHLQTAP